MNLSAHFTLEVFVHSEIAERRTIDNTPDADSMENLLILAGHLEDVRALLGHPILISSGYRSPKLNTVIGGSTNSAHCRGEAADFICPAFGTPREIALAIAASDLKFDQLIWEGTWVHFGIGEKMRQELLTATFEDGKASYTNGIA